MGVPVVTLVGGRHAERTSYSILSNLGVTETIAQTGRDYVEHRRAPCDRSAIHANGRARASPPRSGIRH